MTGNDDACIHYEVVACRVHGEDGWRVAEALEGRDAFKADMSARGLTVVEVRPVVRGSRRAGAVARYDFDCLFARGWSWDEVAHAWRAPEEPLLPLPGEPAVVGDIDVRLEAAKAGGQPVTVSCGGQSIGFAASHIFDPFPEILTWLESIACGDVGRVTLDLEGWYLELLAFAAADPERVRVVAAAVMPGREDRFRKVELDIDIDRRLFVRRFYGAFRAYAESDRYVAKEWAALSMEEDLIGRGIPVSSAGLAKCDAGLLNALLWKLYPDYEVLIPPPVAEGENVGRFVERVLGGERPAGIVWRHRHPEFEIPQEFDRWDTARRLASVNELLEEWVTSWSGYDLRALRSPKLDAMLGEGP